MGVLNGIHNGIHFETAYFGRQLHSVLCTADSALLRLLRLGMEVFPRSHQMGHMLDCSL
jgi:hypothetical protein